jgi:hypothetical protein
VTDSRPQATAVPYFLFRESALHQLSYFPLSIILSISFQRHGRSWGRSKSHGEAPALPCPRPFSPLIFLVLFHSARNYIFGGAFLRRSSFYPQMRKGKKASRHDAKKKSRRYVKAKTKCQHKVEEQCRKQARIRVKPNVKSYKTFAEYAVDLFRVTTSRLNYIYLADRKKCYKKLGHSEKGPIQSEETLWLFLIHILCSARVITYRNRPQ